jgi:hypothetical protein
MTAKKPIDFKSRRAQALSAMQILGYCEPHKPFEPRTEPERVLCVKLVAEGLVELHEGRYRRTADGMLVFSRLARAGEPNGG